MGLDIEKRPPAAGISCGGRGVFIFALIFVFAELAANAPFRRNFGETPRNLRGKFKDNLRENSGELQDKFGARLLLYIYVAVCVR